MKFAPALIAWLIMPFGAAALLSAAEVERAKPLPPTVVPGLRQAGDLFPDATYDASVPKADEFLGFKPGERAANSEQITQTLKAWAEARPANTRLVEYARSHENRPLHYLVVSSAANIARLEEIRGGMEKLADPRKISDDDAEGLIENLPAVAWLAYAIHGDETEGADAALIVLYRLLASQEPGIEQLLKDLVIIVDPLMNPDGRDRFLKMLAEHRGAMPNYDDQSFLHTGYWPAGRGNHYLFDLNRDWILAVHPESRGRIREFGRWNPLLFVDGHGMGAQETHLFSPPREPLNPNFPTGQAELGLTFSRDQAMAFDARGLLYYTREWYESWYPGYSDAYAGYRGAIGILYEQARIAEDGVRRPGGRILSYSESVQHHVIGSFANLHTLQANSKRVREHFYNSRKEAVSPTGRYANRTFAILPTENKSRLADLVQRLEIQGFEIYQATNSFTAAIAQDQLGREERNRSIPAGTILIPNRQPLAHLLAAMLEFDPRLSDTALREEREEILRRSGTRMYDATAWNLTMMFGLPSLELASELPEGVTRYQRPTPTAPAAAAPESLGFVFDGADDQSLAAAGRLMEQGVELRVAEKNFTFDEKDYARGSILALRLDNRDFAGDLAQRISETAQQLGLEFHQIKGGRAAGDTPDLGGEHFQRLERPRIALFGKGGYVSTDYGALWHYIDHELGIRHSQITEGARDFSRYNVLILPQRSGSVESFTLTNELQDWVRNGGTLIAIGSATGPLMKESAKLSKVRSLPDVLGETAKYETHLLREWMSRSIVVPGEGELWSHKANAELAYPWDPDGKDLEEKELKKRDQWQSLFMPQGVILAMRVDPRHWLTMGCEEPLPALISSSARGAILMAGSDVEAPVRLGWLTPGGTNVSEQSSAPEKPSADGKEGDDEKKKTKIPRIGWAQLPKGTEMHLRMSGLLWPEASHRLANSAYVTRESLGRGQIILFSQSPAIRGFSKGATRILGNAIVLGPGVGTAHPVRP